MSNVALLPLIQAVGSVGPREGLSFSFSFTAADGMTPLPLTGIAFTLAVNDLAGLNVFVGSTANGVLEISGDASSVLSCAVPHDVVGAWPSGGYRMTLIASDGAATKGVFVESLLVVGPAQIWSLTTVMPSGSTLTGVAMNPPIVVVSASQTISKAAIYIVTVPGVTLTLNPPASVNGPITIKDVTGNADPNIEIVGAIDGASSMTFHTAYQSVTLQPLASRSIWGNVANAPSSSGESSGGSTITLTANTNLAAGTAVSVNSAGHAAQTFTAAPSIANTATIFAAPTYTSPPTNVASPGVVALSPTLFVAFQANRGTTGAWPGVGAVAFSVSGNVITVGSPSASGGLSNMQAVAALDATHFVYAYYDGSANLKLQVGSVSGMTISLGAAVEAVAAPGTMSSPDRVGIVALSSSAFLFTYSDGSSNVWYVVGLVSGTTITLGTPSHSGLPDISSIDLIPIALSATSVVLVWIDTGNSNAVTAAAGAVSDTTVTLGTPSTVAGSTEDKTSLIGAKVDGTHFCVTWGASAPIDAQFAAAGSVAANAVTWGAKVSVNPNWYQPSMFVNVLSPSLIAFYAGSLLPTLATLSDVTLTPAIGAPLPVDVVPNSIGPNGNTTAPSGTSNVFPPVVGVGTNLLFVDGLWNLYEETSAGIVSPPIAHPGIITYAFAPISSTQALALLIDNATNILARVITFQPINSRPIGCVASPVTSGGSATITLIGACSGFSGLTPGSEYFANGDGTLTAGDTGWSMGIAISSSQLIVSPAKG